MHNHLGPGPSAVAGFADLCFHVVRAILGVAALVTLCGGIAALGLFAFVQLSDVPIYVAVPNRMMLP